MTSPAANPPRPVGSARFSTLIHEAATEGPRVRGTAAFALRTGVIPDEIIDYVRGTLRVAHRPSVDAMLAGSPWAMGRVVALVKARRKPGSLGARLLAGSTPVDPYAWGVQRTPDEGADLATLLDLV